MRKRLTLFPVLVIILLAGLLFASAAEDKETALKAEAVADNLYLVQGTQGGNVAFLVTEKGVLVVDSGTTPVEGKQIVALIAKKTNAPIRYVVVTHYHFDHTLGLQSFPESALVIGHHQLTRNIKKINRPRLEATIEKTLPERIKSLQEKAASLVPKKKEELEKTKQALRDAEDELADLKACKLRLPDITFAESFMLTLGNETVHLFHPGASHTNGNIIALFPRQKTVHMGDMFFHLSLPYIDFNAGSNTANWVAQLEKVLKYNVEKLIPGHGPVTDKEGLKKQIAYLNFLRRSVAEELKKGSGLEAMRKNISLAPEYKEWGFQTVFPGNIEAVYVEMTAPALQVLQKEEGE